jgi:N-acetylglucosaminyldiphosphoundecaprenol N-acetyl-beta-D-mannosaminyltransferase
MGVSVHSELALPAAQPRPSVLGMHVDAVCYERAVRLIGGWCREERPRYVCVANVHMVMEAQAAPELLQAINGADLVVPDGMPLVWVLRRRGYALPDRVYGPTLMLELCAWASRTGVPVGFIGATPDVLEQLAARLAARFPDLAVAFTHSPPFGARVPPADASTAAAVRTSGARLLFVGLGCPKQERWMAANAASLGAVMVGVGAAFDFHAGTLRQAPAWMQRRGLEWLFRFAMEPRRLWRRYVYNNPRFAAQVLREEFQRRRSASRFLRNACNRDESHR